MTHANKTQGYRPKQKAIYFGALDGFRGIFALMVAIHHSSWFSYINYRSFIDQAFVVIDLFFAFSGFLLYTLYHDKLNDKTQCLAFLKRRFARLYPLHLFMLCVFIAYALVKVFAAKSGIFVQDPGEVLPFQAGSRDSLYAIFTNITMLHSLGLHDSLTFNAPSWTVSVEFYTYFLFMALMLWAAPKKSWHFLILSLIVIAIYYGLSQIPPRAGFSKKMDITYDFGFFRCVAGFFLGMIAAQIFAYLRRSSSIIYNFTRWHWTLIECLMVIIGAIFLIYWTGPLQFFVGPVILAFVVIFAFDGGYISKFMSQNLFQYLAKISYSVYMVHLIISIAFAIIGTSVFTGYITIPELLDFGAKGTGLWGDLYMIPYLLTVIFVSHLTYHFVEVPGGRLIRQASLSKLKMSLSKS